MTDELTKLLEFRPTHLAWPLPSDVVERVGEEDALLYLRERKVEIEQSERDPLKLGYEPRVWEKVDWHIKDLREKYPSGVIKIVIFGGHRSSKTRKASNYVNRSLIEKPGSRWWCCDSTEAQSRANQMRLMWEQFPIEWRNLARSQVTDIRYSQADGFSKNLFVCPNKSEVAFKFYSMDLEGLPGPELDGVWADELIPLSWVHFLGFRLANRNGILIITFCPEFGWNETFGYFYEGAQVLEEAQAPLLQKYDSDGRLIGHGKVPRVMQCTDPTARILFFHTSDNPFGNYPALVQELKSKKAGEEEISVRAYGLCTRAHDVAFPLFSKDAHVISSKSFSTLLEEYPKGERYHLVDPCDGRMWFMVWVWCPRPNRWVIYRESPSHDHRDAYIQGHGIPGPWALAGEAADGVKGPGQQSYGWSLERYKEEILQKEGEEPIVARYIDSRYSTSPKSERERMTTLIEQMTETGMDFYAMVAGKGRIIGFENSDGSVDMINSALFYDVECDLGKWSGKLGRMNEPQLQVLETCPNTIWALEHWTGSDGQKGACKDPIDCIRGLFLTSVNYCGESMYAWKGGGIPR